MSIMYRNSVNVSSHIKRSKFYSVSLSIAINIKKMLAMVHLVQCNKGR